MNRAAAASSSPTSDRLSPVAAALPLLLLLALLTAAGGALAHADLVEATPPPNSHVDAAPGSLLLVFSEALETRYTKVSVLDNRGNDYAKSTDIDPGARTRVTVPLKPMPDGVYTVRWRTLSVDTHQKSGAHLLAIGNATLGSGDHAHMDHSAHMGGSEDHSAHGGGLNTEATTRATGFLAASLLLGIPLFLLAMPRGLVAARHHTLLAAVAGAAGLAAAAAGYALATLIARRIEGTVSDVFATTSGSWLLWRTGLLAAAGLAALAAALPPARRAAPALLATAAALGLGGAAATSLSSHAAAQDALRWLALTVDWAHLVAVAFWVGGVVALLALSWTRQPDAATAFRAIVRFSPLAVASVALIVATGTYASLLHLTTWEDLRSTYGTALAVKVLLIVPLLGIGYANRYVFAPRLLHAVPKAGLRGLRALMATEVLAMTAVLVAAGVLANTAPPASSVAGADGGAHLMAPPGTIHEFNASGHHVYVALTPRPVQVGFQNLTVAVHPTTAQPLQNATVYVNLRPPGGSIEDEILHELLPSGAMRWSRAGPLFTEPGEWNVEVIVQGKGASLKGSLRVTVS